MKTIKDEILLIIPYINSGQGNELELALTGWRKYCQSPLRIIVVGDYNPCIDGKAEHLPVPQAPAIGGQYMPNIDVAGKLDVVYDTFHNEYDHFVLANDDEYPIREFDWEFLTKCYVLQPSFIGNKNLPSNYWAHDMSKTRIALDKEKKPHLNFCNHHPFYFDMEKFHEISVKFDLMHNSMIRENLYYNYYNISPIGNVNEVRYGQWDQKLEGARRAVRDPKIKFMCNSVAGWSKEFEEIIRRRYEIDSKEGIESKIEVSDEIIVSFTSWKKRIKNCSHSIDLMMNQTIKPNKIILNLSTDEFPNKEDELPEDLVQKQNDVFEIYWVKENTKVYKKILPTLERFPNSVILGIDDDIEYPKDYIETLYKEFIKNGKRHPIAAFKNKKELDVMCHSGPFSLVKSEFFGPYLKDLYDNVVMKNGINTIYASDDIYFYAALLNGISYKLVDTLILNKMKSLYATSSKVNTVNYSSYNKDWHIMYKNEISLIRNYIEKTYNKSYKELVENAKIEKPILTVLTMTSWSKRIQYVNNSIKKFFSTQTIKPDIFYLWLSLEEFPNKESDLPKDLIETCNKFGVKIEWLPYNDRNFKRWYVYPKHYNDLVISIDDDINVDKNLIKIAKTHINEVNTIYNIFENLTWEYEYGQTTKIIYKKKNKFSLKYMLLGCSVVCPKSFPLEAITEENSEIRRQICRRCDESWIKPFTLLNNTKIGYLNFNSKNYMNMNMQEDASWKILSSRVDGILVRDYQVYVNLKYFPKNMKKYKEVFPNYSTDKFDKLGTEYILKNILNK